MTQIQIKTSNGITIVPVDSVLLTDRKLFLEGEINEESSCDLIKDLMYLISVDPHKPVDLFINSPGGEVNAGMMIYDILQSCRTPVRTWCIGRAYSMAAVLVACGRNGRYILPHGELMLHEPLLGNRIDGNSSSIKSISDRMLSTKCQLNKLLAEHTGRSIEEIEEETGFDHYFSAQESVDFGLVDEIAGLDRIMNT